MSKNGPTNPAKDHEGIGTKLKTFVIRLIEIINYVAFYVAVGFVGSAIGADDAVHADLGTTSNRNKRNSKGGA